MQFTVSSSLSLKSRSAPLFINCCFTTASVFPLLLLAELHLLQQTLGLLPRLLPNAAAATAVRLIISFVPLKEAAGINHKTKDLKKTVRIFDWRCFMNQNLKLCYITDYYIEPVFIRVLVACSLLTFAMSSAPPRGSCGRWDDCLIRDSGPMSKRGRLMSAYSTSDWPLGSGR